MKTFNLLAVSLMVLTATAASGQGRIEVSVKNLKNETGSIRIGLFTTDDNFLKDAVQGKVVKAGKNVSVVFENLEPGEYAVSVIHDENENGKLDKNVIGIPYEGFGFGNNAMGTFGPPSFDEAKVNVGKDAVKQEIELKYY